MKKSIKIIIGSSNIGSMERLFNRIMLKIVRFLMQIKSARTSFYHILTFLFICIWFLILRKPSRNNKEKWKTAFMQKLFPLHLYLLVTLDHENNMSLYNSSVDLRFYSGGYLWRDRLKKFYVLGWLTSIMSLFVCFKGGMGTSHRGLLRSSLCLINVSIFAENPQSFEFSLYYYSGLVILAWWIGTMK